MPLFQNSVIRKYTNDLDKQKVQDAYTLFRAYFFNPTIQANIREAKEEQFQEGFLRALFGKILGYTLNPLPDYNLTTELKNTYNSKKADGAIIIDNKPVAVIELKGTETTDLSKIESQAFGYKNNQQYCTYVIISNFEKLRFYIDNAIEFFEFNLFTLNRDDFNLLWLCLSFNSIAQNIPKKIKEESLSQEDTITKKLYNDYSLFKRKLHQNLVALNPQFDALTLFKKSQKLLDRFLFLFFAEDRQLLPPNSVRLILNDWKDLQERDVEIPLYDRFKKYFEYLNTGYKGKRYNVYAYNGGLFKADNILDAVKIEDNLLFEYTLKLSEYDFASEVDVNILGHIFENSLNELDEIKAQLEGQEIDKTKTKRKKDGVFYTPKYITKYIVDNTVGKLCVEKKTELKINEEDYITDKKRPKKTVLELAEKLTNYRNWLLQLTICDPACGSGAFLNQALDFLIREHKNIDELQAKLFGDAFVMSDIENSILENNLFGVDLNEESVEIAKLSLWLRTAQPNRKLNNLNNNIKCGNSLIDDPAVAGEKAFNWHNEFSKVFEKGGFDVVIGNPPYGILLDKDMQDYYRQKFPLTKYKTNLYVLFIERMMQVFEKGIIHFIVPKSLLLNTYYEEIRKYLINYTEINELFSITEKVFEDAEVGGSLLLQFTIKKEINKNCMIRLASAEKIQNFITQTGITENRESQNYFLSVPNCEISIVSTDNQSVINKLNKLKPINYYYTLKNGLNPGNIKHILISDSKKTEKHKPIIWGKDISRYNIIWSGQYINYDFSIGDTISLDDIKSKEGMNKQNRIDFALRSSELFETRKIVVRKTGDSLIGSIDENNYYFDTLVHGIYELKKDYGLEFLLSIINSKPATKLYRLLHNIQGKVFAKISLDNLSSFPIPDSTFIGKNSLDEKVQTILKITKELQDLTQKFQRAIQREFGLEDLSNKLQNWYELSYAEFIIELEKKKIKITLSEKAEWEDYFLQESKKALELKTKIEATDKEIDQMVYELYGLTEEEIKIVEGI
ncbi:MAG: N-6 DNA methylase [Bacteroidales bacterium]|nr:N-6 DNA methylase [Bacteroidales bacterium]